MSSNGELMGVNGMNSNGMGNNGMTNMNQDPNLHPFGVIPDGSVPDASSNLTDEQAEHLSRSNSLKRLSAGGGGDRRNMTGPGPGGSGRGSFEQNYAGGIASTMPTGMNPSLAYLSNGQNGHSYSQGYEFSSHGNGMQPQSNVDMSYLQSGRNVYQPTTAGQQHGYHESSQIYNPQSQNNNYINTYNPNLPAQQLSTIKTDPHIKPDPQGSIYGGVYSGAVPVPSDFPTWDIQNDPVQEVSSKLLFFCFPNNQVISRGNDIRSYLSPDNIKHFLEKYTNFQGHFPLIHMPTFRIADAHESLLLGIICIGAVYSERMAPSQARDMMEFSKAVIERTSTLVASLSQDYSGGTSMTSSKTDLEQLTALHMMQVLFTWHGTPVQRESARRQFSSIVALTRKLGLTTPVTTGSFSVCHQRHFKTENHIAAEFDWNAWIEQERRSRLMYAIYLTDAAMVLYFNSSPLFEALEIRIPLPADDAAWDARSSAHCAEALGLKGIALARERNPAGSRRTKQPEMHSALETLMRTDIDLQPGTTNLYSKFVLIHALHVQLWNAQKQLSQEGGNPQNPAFPGSGSSTPLTQNDWVVRGIDGTTSTASSGRATPVDGGASQQLLKAANSAFDKWKKVWDDDMAVQYPPSSTSYRRFGFCRDGVHFYWLGKYLMKNNRGSEWQMAPDQRFSQVMHLLKYVQGFVTSDSAKRGEEPGSVNDVDHQFGVRDLTLDMSQLFKPINKQIDSPVMGVHTGSG
jgi:hypothetical protein